MHLKCTAASRQCARFAGCFARVFARTRPAVVLGFPPRSRSWVVAVMTLHKLHAADGYSYQVAAGDGDRTPGQALANYYTATGNPPGRWMDAGAADLAVAGRLREEPDAVAVRQGHAPDAEQIIGPERAAGRGERETKRTAKLGGIRQPPAVGAAGGPGHRAAGGVRDRARPPSIGRRSFADQGGRSAEGAQAGGRYDLVSTRSRAPRCCGPSTTPPPGRRWKMRTMRRSPTPWPGWNTRPHSSASAAPRRRRSTPAATLLRRSTTATPAPEIRTCTPMWRSRTTSVPSPTNPTATRTGSPTTPG